MERFAVLLFLKTSAVFLLSTSFATAQDDDEIEVIPIEIDDAGPMGLGDIATIFPFAGPFAPDDSAPGDRFLHDMFDNVPPVFAQQLLPVIQSRFPSPESHPCNQDVNKYCPHADAPLHCLGKNAKSITPGCVKEIKSVVPFVCADPITRWCGDNLEKGVIPCLESRGSDLGQDCADAIVAAKHAIASISNTLQKATGKKDKPPLVNDGTCPRGFNGPKKDTGCCIRKWSRDCDAACSMDRCTQDSNWEWQWLDFRVKPYTCCPKVTKPSSKYIGGQPLCPTGWYSETQKKNAGHCCRRPWSWECGQGCAESDCDVHGWAWWPVDASKEHYKCCPNAPGDTAGKGSTKDGTDSKTSSGSTGSVTKRPTKSSATVQDKSGSAADASASASYIAPLMDLIGNPAQPAAWGLVLVLITCGMLCLVRRIYMAHQEDNKEL